MVVIHERVVGFGHRVPGHIGRTIQPARVGGADDAHLVAGGFQLVLRLEHRQQNHVAGDREHHGLASLVTFVQRDRAALDPLARLIQRRVHRQRRLRGDDRDALVVRAQRPVISDLNLVGVAREQRINVAVAHLRGEVVLDFRTLMRPAVAALFQRAGGKHADEGRRLAAQFGHRLRHCLHDRPAVDREALVRKPDRTCAEQRHAGGQTGAGILVERLVNLAVRLLVIQRIVHRVANLQCDVDVGHCTGFIAVGIGHHKIRIALADRRDQRAEGGRRHLLLARLEGANRQFGQRHDVQHMLGHRRLRGRPAACAAEVVAHQLPGFGADRTALQAGDDMLGIQRVGRIQVVRLGANLVYAGALQLLQDQHRALAAQRTLRGAIRSLQYGGGEGLAAIEGERGAVNVGADLITIIEILGIDQEHVFETVALPVGRHLGIAPGRTH